MALFSALQKFITKNGQPVEGASVLVKLAGSATAATVYATRDGGTKSNPFLTLADGNALCYVSPGRYDMTVTFNGDQITFNDVEVGPVSNIGTFAAGGVVTDPDQLVEDAAGNKWRWTGALNYTFAPGEDPELVVGWVKWVDAAGTTAALEQALANGSADIAGQTASQITLNAEKSAETIKTVQSPGFYQRASTVSLILDGGYSYNFSSMIPFFALKGIKATFAIPTGQVRGIAQRFSSAVVATAKQIYDAQIAGHEIMSHGLSEIVAVKDPLDAQIAEQETDQSYRDLRRLGVNVKGWISYFSNLDPLNVPYVTRKHAIPFGSSAVTDARNFSTVTYNSDTYFATNRIVRAGLETVIDESGVTISGTAPADVAEKLRIHKLLADYCLANNRHVVLYHHDVSNGEFPQGELDELIDYYNAIGLSFITTSEQFQLISDVTTKQAKIEQLEYDIGELYSTTHENLIKYDDLRTWTRSVLSGSAPTESFSASKTSSATTIALPGNSVGESVRYSRIIENFGQLGGDGGTVCLSFRYRSNVNDTYNNPPIAATGAVNIVVRSLTAADVEVERVEKTYSHMDQLSRECSLVLSDIFTSEATATKLQIIIDIKSGDGVARDVIIEDLTMSRGSNPARYSRSENYSLIAEKKDANLVAAGTYDPFLSSVTTSRHIRKIVLTSGQVSSDLVRGFTEVDPAKPGTYTLGFEAGSAAVITFTVGSNMSITVDSITGAGAGIAVVKDIRMYA